MLVNHTLLSATSETLSYIGGIDNSIDITRNIETAELFSIMRRCKYKYKHKQKDLYVYEANTNTNIYYKQKYLYMRQLKTIRVAKGNIVMTTDAAVET